MSFTFFHENVLPSLIIFFLRKPQIDETVGQDDAHVDRKPGISPIEAAVTNERADATDDATDEEFDTTVKNVDVSNEELARAKSTPLYDLILYVFKKVIMQ